MLPALGPSAGAERVVLCAGAVSETLAELIVSDPASQAFGDTLVRLGSITGLLFEAERDAVLPAVDLLQSLDPDADQRLATELEVHLNRALGESEVRAFSPTVRGEP